MHFDSIDLYRPPTSETTDADRPLTTAHHNRNSTSDRPSLEESQDADFSEASPPFTETHCPEPTGHLLQISLTETWGGSDFIGLTGIAVLTSGEEVLQLRKEQLSSEIDGQRSDSEVASLLDGVNMTCDVEHMWIVPFDSSQPPTLTLSLDAPTHITGLLVWNYNASAEDSYSGASTVVCLYTVTLLILLATCIRLTTSSCTVHIVCVVHSYLYLLSMCFVSQHNASH